MVSPKPIDRLAVLEILSIDTNQQTISYSIYGHMPMSWVLPYDNLLVCNSMFLGH